MKIITILNLTLVLATITAAASAEEEQSTRFINVGIGGGGGMFVPVCSPHDHGLMFVSCDMSGVYRSTDGGESWSMLDKRELRSATSCTPLFHPGDPDMICAYGSGRLRVTRDGGQTWHPLSEDQPWSNEAIIALGTIPDRPTTLFAGTATAVYQSDDYAESWSKLEGISGRTLNFASDAKGDNIFIGTRDGVFRSQDGGKTWSDVSRDLPWRDLRGFCGGFDTETGQMAIYCTIPAKVVDGKLMGGVYRSLDRGDSWQSAMGDGINREIGKKDQYGRDDLPQYYQAAMAQTHPNVIYATTLGTGYWPPYHWTVYRSEDFGDSWEYCFTGDPRFEDRNVELGWLTTEFNWGWGGPPSGFSVCSNDPDIAMYTNNGALYITRNGGKTWRYAYSRRVDPQGDVKKGEKWASCGLEVTSCWQFAFDPHDRNRAYICYTDIGFARSEDRGKTWSISVTGSPWRNTWYQITSDPTHPGMIYAACSNQHDIPHWSNIESARGSGGVCISEDSGITWKRLGSGLPDAPATSIVLDPQSPETARTLYAAMFGHGVFKSTDGGATWHRKSDGLGTAENMHVYSLKLHSDGMLFCSVTGKRTGSQFADGSGLYRSTDGGESWELISLPIKWVGDFDLDPRDSRVIYLTAASAPGYSQGGLYKTTDGGTTWEQPLKQDDFPKDLRSYVHAFFVTVNPKRPETVYLSATTHGLFVTEDAGENWREVSGIPFTPTQRVTFDPDDQDIIWVTTFGGGVWKGSTPASP